MKKKWSPTPTSTLGEWLQYIDVCLIFCLVFMVYQYYYPHATRELCLPFTGFCTIQVLPRLCMVCNVRIWKIRGYWSYLKDTLREKSEMREVLLECICDRREGIQHAWSTSCLENCCLGWGLDNHGISVLAVCDFNCGQYLYGFGSRDNPSMAPRIPSIHLRLQLPPLTGHFMNTCWPGLCRSPCKALQMAAL